MLLHLAENQEVQEKCYSELAQVMNLHGELKQEGKRMKYILAINHFLLDFDPPDCRKGRRNPI